MRYQISGMHIDIGQALQTHVKNELGDAVIKYAERPTDANSYFQKVDMNTCVKQQYIYRLA